MKIFGTEGRKLSIVGIGQEQTENFIAFNSECSERIWDRGDIEGKTG